MSSYPTQEQGNSASTSTATLDGAPSIVTYSSTNQDSCSTTSTWSSNYTQSNLIGPGRILGNLFSAAGRNLERNIQRTSANNRTVLAGRMGDVPDDSSTASTWSTNYTTSNLVGAGRGLGLLFSAAGRSVEKNVGDWMVQTVQTTADRVHAIIEAYYNTHWLNTFLSSKSLEKLKRDMRSDYFKLLAFAEYVTHCFDPCCSAGGSLYFS